MKTLLPKFNPDYTRARQDISRCPHYKPTPLQHITLEGLSVAVKNESHRFGLGSFKALGGVYAVVNALRHQSSASLSLDEVFDPQRKPLHANTAFVCASAGNHGIAVASGARLTGAVARIHLSREVPEDFAQRLRDLGATVVRSGNTYEQSLEAALDDAQSSGATLVADTAWDGYTEIPAMIMEGYTLIGQELADTFATTGEWPTDVYLQAGVGGLAGAMTWYIRHQWTVQPRIVIVEPDAAPCLAASHESGTPVTVEGPTSTMGRLDCKSASPLAVDALQKADVEFRAISDSDSTEAVAILETLGLATTPSGGAGFAALLADQKHSALSGNAPLIILSEGALGG